MSLDLEALDARVLSLDSSLKRLQKLERNLRRLGIGGAYGNSGTRPRKKSQSLERVIMIKIHFSRNNSKISSK